MFLSWDLSVKIECCIKSEATSVFVYTRLRAIRLYDIEDDRLVRT